LTGRAGAAAVLALACALVAGCGEPPAEGGDPTSGRAETAADTTAAEPGMQPAAPGGLVPITHGAWEERLAGYAPDIVVVDFWATWCTPCIERFPKMVEMAERYRDRGVRFVSMCMEDREDTGAVAGAERFLAAQAPPFDNFLLDEPLLEGFRLFGLQTIPAVHVYGRDGALATRLTGDDPRNQFDEADVEVAIEALL
jgi:thiol-disulfide isomerase/thioredoxin